jgi:hypothetical protein
MSAPYYPDFTMEQAHTLHGRKGILAFLDGTMPGRKGKCSSEKSIARNTVAFYLAGSIYIKLHRTNILTFDKQGRPTLRMGPWNTVTTRERMNRFLPERWQVFNRKGEAYVGFWHGPQGTATRFTEHYYVEGMRLNLNGTVTYPGRGK